MYARWKWIAALAVAGTLRTGHAWGQTATVGPKQPIAAPATSKDPEIDHMEELVTKLKAEVPKIQDPVARQAAADNLDLWQHLIDRLLQQNKAANNTGAAHHHGETAPAPPKTAVPKPQ